MPLLNGTVVHKIRSLFDFKGLRFSLKDSTTRYLDSASRIDALTKYYYKN